jgi:hypothetical protein
MHILFQDSFDSRHSTGAVRPSGLSPDSGIFEMIGSEFSGVVTDFPEPDTVPRMQNDFRLPGPFTGEFTTHNFCSIGIQNIKFVLIKKEVDLLVDLKKIN